MNKFFIATSNLGKQKDIRKYAEMYGDKVHLVFPNKSNELKVEESGNTFEENALLKATAYRDTLDGVNNTIYVGDDSGITIPALHNEPGVYTRRWNGKEMLDQEIMDYCLERMSGLKGDDRRALFQTILAVIYPDGSTRYIRGTMSGHILEEPLEGVEPQPGFPFRSIFWVDGLDVPIYKIHDMTIRQRGGFLTHREDAFKQLFEKR